LLGDAEVGKLRQCQSDTAGLCLFLLIAAIAAFALAFPTLFHFDQQLTDATLGAHAHLGGMSSRPATDRSRGRWGSITRLSVKTLGKIPHGHRTPRTSVRARTPQVGRVPHPPNFSGERAAKLVERHGHWPHASEFPCLADVIG
jgi:hypothetical protein